MVAFCAVVARVVAEAFTAVKTIVVTGATSLIGHFLLPRLAGADYRVVALSRRPQAGAPAGVEWRRMDIADPSGAEPPPGDALIHLAPLWLLPDLLARSPAFGSRRIIAFSSTSRISKEDSPNPRERALAQRLATAEERLLALPGTRVTIFRPTLIYGAGLDQNISLIARNIRRFHLFPLIGSGSGQRQPVHADDLARACLLALARPETEGRIYTLTGGETLSYRQMVIRVFKTLELTPRLVSTPEAAVRALLSILSWWPRLRHLTPDMASRMNHDLVFDSLPAERDLGYTARPFFPQREDLGV